MKSIGISTLIIFCVLMSGLKAQAAVPTKAEFTINQKYFKFEGCNFDMDVAPFIENGRTYVPVRYMAKVVGVPDDLILWDGENGIVTLVNLDSGIKLGLKLGEDTAFLNDSPMQMDVPPVLVDGRVFLPARYIAEAYGFNVEWDGSRVTLRKANVISVRNIRRTINNTSYLDAGEILKKVGVDNFKIQFNQLSVNENEAVLSDDKTTLFIRLKNGVNMDIQLSSNIVVEGDRWFVGETDLSKIVLLGKILSSS